MLRAMPGDGRFAEWEVPRDACCSHGKVKNSGGRHVTIPHTSGKIVKPSDRAADPGLFWAKNELLTARKLKKVIIL
jgi:hypothetical protein